MRNDRERYDVGDGRKHEVKILFWKLFLQFPE
jgi:hypothetical protein